ncbi:MAG: SCO family protein [Gemmatimonadota bacterium]
MSVALVALAALLTACGGPPDGSSGMSATEFPRPYHLPVATLTDQRGEPFELHAGGSGKLTLLYFGYTHCPDICPITMARVARALELLEPEERAQVRTIFVTLDADRDDPERLARWLGAIDSTFIGLTGSQDELDAALGAFGYVMPPGADRSTADYEVAHPPTLFLFTREPLGRFGYAHGVEAPELLAADLRHLLEAER